MQIHVKLPSGKAIMLDVERDDLIESVRQRIEEKEGMPYQQRLFLGWEELENGHTLSDYRIFDKTTLKLFISIPPNLRSGQIQVLIIAMSIPNISPLVVELTDTVISLKEKIQDVRGIPPDLQRYIVRGVLMEDERLHGTYGLERDYKIHLVLKLRGD